MAIDPQDEAEAHVLALLKIELEAQRMMDEVYVRFRATPSVRQIGMFFDSLEQAAAEIIGRKGQEAIDEAKRYSWRLLGFEPNVPTLGGLGGTVEYYLAVIAEDKRYSLALIRLRAGRMQDKGIANDQITRVLEEDYRHGGESFGLFKGRLRRHVGDAVNQLGKEAEFAALRPRAKVAA